MKKHIAFLVSEIAVVVLVLTNVANANSLDHQQYYARGTDYLEEANRLRHNSAQAIITANALRKEIIKLRAQARKADDAKAKANISMQADRLAIRLQERQIEGSVLREKSQQVHIKALHALEEGLVSRWGKTLQDRKPLIADESTMLIMAHNTKFRSVHPQMLNQMGTPSELADMTSLAGEMSLLVPALAGQNAPSNLDISSFQLSRDQGYFAHIEVLPESTDARGDDGTALVPLNSIHQWQLIITNLAGEALTGADIEIIGHMPGHVHGLPTQPRVTEEIAPGVYRVEGVKFQMKGWWVMQFNIHKGDKAVDSLTFNLVL